MVTFLSASKSIFVQDVRKCIAVVSFLGLTACATTSNKSNEPSEPRESNSSVSSKEGSPVSSKKRNPQDPGLDQKMGTALTSPLSDLNLVRTSIPVILISAQKAPYALKETDSCETHLAELDALNDVLGSDLDELKYDDKGNLIEQGGAALGDAAVGALRGVTEGVIPFRSWIRKLTGAERYAKDVAAASMAGLVRRAFLKGVVKMKTCTLPKVEKMSDSTPSTNQ